jgi:hypothetical protein
VKFILEEGETEEKRDILNCIRGRITLSENELKLD